MKLKASNDNARLMINQDYFDRDKAYDSGQAAATQGAQSSECPFDEDDDADLEAAWMDGFYSIAAMPAD